ncbi:Protein of unknown function [Nocardioides terrae]|uniref:DUF3558 domain-containing protein n=1 Tax=Nocardioides terrae TaxID=574651 RepID=A0A1I1GSE1_9ACTN|nr:DUF3558 family protein [Nocardioides terrae]SFC14411.1 Protein of unknown function [Nocardioides terrae]
MTHRRPTALLLGGLTTLSALLAGCSSDDSPSAHATPTSAAGSPTGSPSSAPSAAAPTLNPCDAVDVAAVSRVLGSKLTKETGTAAAPRCTLTPVEKGGPAFDLSYLWFDQGLEAAWSSMQVPAGTVSRPTVPGADDARLVVNDSGSAYAVTAFLQNGKLIQSVNALALAPYDGPKVLHATKLLLRQLSASRS